MCFICVIPLSTHVRKWSGALLHTKSGLFQRGVRSEGASVELVIWWNFHQAVRDEAIVAALKQGWCFTDLLRNGISDMLISLQIACSGSNHILSVGVGCVFYPCLKVTQHHLGYTLHFILWEIMLLFFCDFVYKFTLTDNPILSHLIKLWMIYIVYRSIGERVGLLPISPLKQNRLIPLTVNNKILETWYQNEIHILENCFEKGSWWLLNNWKANTICQNKTFFCYLQLQSFLGSTLEKNMVLPNLRELEKWWAMSMYF